MMIISHVRQPDLEIQTNEEHQYGVAMLAKKFAAEFGMGEWGRILGLLHDKGKERIAFQSHIIKNSGIDPSTIVEGDYRHAFVGALIAKVLFPKHAPLLVNPLSGHHRGLYNDGDLRTLLKTELPKDVTVEAIPVQFENPAAIVQKEKDIHHLQRLLYSCLVDADYLDTEAFMMPDQSRIRRKHSDLNTLYEKLCSHIRTLSENAPKTEVNKIRKEVQRACLKEADGDVGIYSLTVPTGGGKTLSSVLWGLKHALKNDLKRIIIAIPYTSIIVQTAAVLRNIFGEENVLEHHSEKDYDETAGEMVQRQKLATENWDYPIVVTTNVQLFESLFNNRPSHCRKLHNIANSVVVLDEVQTLPVEFLCPIVDTMDTLNRVFKVSILLTTASQPVLTGTIVGTNRLYEFDALHEIKEIIPDGSNLHQRLQRTSLKFDEKKSDYEDIAKRLTRHSRVLCIVNTRKDAREIFNRLPDEGHRIHLSRMMCPDHVKSTIKELKQLLSNNDDKPIRVVATQLIEAGVDIDFPVVFRQEAGLDSILQAAGRCNREGRLPQSTTFVFSLKKPLPPGHLSQTNDARKALGNDRDWFAPQTMTDYFKQRYSRVDNFDKAKIKELLYKHELNFETACKKFHLIDDNTTPVIVEWKDSASLVERLKSDGISYRLMKQLQRYCVNVRQNDFKNLTEAGAIEEVSEGVYSIVSSGFYDENVGLITTNKWLEETLII